MLAKQFWTLRLAAPRCVVRPIDSGLAKNYQKYGGSARSVIGLSKIGKLNILKAISQQLQQKCDRQIDRSATPKVFASKDFSSQPTDRHSTTQCKVGVDGSQPDLRASASSQVLVVLKAVFSVYS